MENIGKYNIVEDIVELFNEIRSSKAISLVEKLKPFFYFIQKRVLANIRWEEGFLYCTLPIWSYKENKFPEGYPYWYRDGQADKLYLELCNIFKNPNFCFSFVRFVSHQIRRIPNVFVIEFLCGDDNNKGTLCKISNDGICEFRLKLHVNKNIVDYFEKNKAWNDGYDVMPDDIKLSYNNFLKAVNKCTINNSPFLQVVDEKKEKELFFGFFKFVYAYASVFKDKYKVKTLYVFPAKVHKTSKGYDLGYGCFIVASDQFNLFDYDSQKAISLVMNLCYSSLAISDWADFRNYKESLTAIKSAVGSIMSRNGSHNIGSHVLAALSHNVGTLPDDRVLYQHIQQRMDYIATVTTDFPTWTQPTMFVADMMKTFLSQRHLLDHIVESEGLRAFQFQNPNMDDDEWFDQKNCIQIHVRRVGADGEDGIDIIRYDSKDDRTKPLDLKQDIALAIPGGIIGEHAFYTILENIIRNAAKHAWAPLSKEEKEKYGNLEIYIDFEDCDSVVKFTVYTKLPLKKEEIDRVKKSQNDCDVKTWVDKFDNSEGLRADDQKEFDNLPIHHRQQIMLARPFIDSQGALRRENWGLAEMKISAGYLAGKDVDVIGGLRNEGKEIIEPCIIEETDKDNGAKYFGYNFSIAKPKEILIIVKNQDEWANTTGVMKENGIFVKTIEKAKEELQLNYRYIVHYDATEFFDIETREPKDGILIPFRMLSGKKVPENKEDENEKISDWSWLQPFVADLDDGIEKDKNGFEQLKKSFEDGLVDDVRKIVYKAYYEHLKKSRNKGNGPEDEIKEIGLLVAINENEKSGGNSLISDADILELMLEQNFATCVDQYKAFAVGYESRTIFEWLDSIRHKSSDARKVIKFKHFSNKTIRELIAQRMYDWMNEDENESSGKDAKGHLKEKYYTDEAAENDNGGEKKPSDSKKGNDDFEAKVNALLKRHPIDDFIRYVESVFENTKKLFKQYEEQIVTLPAGYKINTASEAEQKNKGSNNEVALDGVEIVTNIEGVKDKDRHWIGYRRHAHTLPVDASKSLYVEPLSGTQTYLSQLARVKTDLGLQMHLIENGLMRILVLDERVAKFLREHQKEVGPHYQSMGINVIDHEWVESGNKKERPDWSYSSFSCKTKEDLRNYVDGGNPELKMFNDVDILIVHQGILDKWFEEFKSDKEKMRKLLEGFKKLVKYVVVTTGRGTPVNIPEETHLLPFAVVESTLFKKYPEKLILTDTIMNVLPVGKKNATGGQK